MFPSQATRHCCSKHAEKHFPLLLTRLFDYRIHTVWPSHGSQLTQSFPLLTSYTPSQADIAVFKAFSQDLGYPNVARWYEHIKSYKAEFPTLSGSGSASAIFTSEAVPTSAPAEKKKKAGDDDIDLFRSDEEVDAKVEKLKAEPVTAYNAKRANKPKTIAKLRNTYTPPTIHCVYIALCSLS